VTVLSCVILSVERVGVGVLVSHVRWVQRRYLYTNVAYHCGTLVMITVGVTETQVLRADHAASISTLGGIRTSVEAAILKNHIEGSYTLRRSISRVESGKEERAVPMTIRNLLGFGGRVVLDKVSLTKGYRGPGVL
jgi:hypothetical protein